MNTYYIENKVTEEQRIVFGFTWKQACKKYNLNPNEWCINVCESPEWD